jgi:hypothetical protein
MWQRVGRLMVWGMVLAFAGGCAGPAMPPRGLAQYHWEAIARSDIGMTTIHYTPNSTLEWVGGPLQGKYAGPTAIAEVWTKFFNAQRPTEVEVSNVQERQEGGRQAVAARVLFKGRRAVPVDYLLVFDGGRIVAETWKVVP